MDLNEYCTCTTASAGAALFYPFWPNHTIIIVIIKRRHQHTSEITKRQHKTRRRKRRKKIENNIRSMLTNRRMARKLGTKNFIRKKISKISIRKLSVETIFLSFAFVFWWLINTFLTWDVICLTLQSERIITWKWEIIRRRVAIAKINCFLSLSFFYSFSFDFCILLWSQKKIFAHVCTQVFVYVCFSARITSQSNLNIIKNGTKTKSCSCVWHGETEREKCGSKWMKMHLCSEKYSSVVCVKFRTFLHVYVYVCANFIVFLSLDACRMKETDEKTENVLYVAAFSKSISIASSAAIAASPYATQKIPTQTQPNTSDFTEHRKPIENINSAKLNIWEL